MGLLRLLILGLILLVPPVVRAASAETAAIALTAPALARPLEPVTLQLASMPPNLGAVTWYVDGQAVQTSTATEFTTTFPTAGRRTIAARLAYDRRVLSASVDVRSYANIRLVSLLPNPDGSDTKREQIVLANDNDFPVTLAAWRLQSRISQTFVAIEATLPPHEETTITASSKLRNSGGTYDLLNESGAVVDTVSYDTPDEGQVLTRTGILWPMQQTELQINEVEVPEKVTIIGTVTKPSGRTVDLVTDDGQAVRVVVHTSFDHPKPRLSVGDRIRVTGEWRRSRRGPYISVRAGDTFLLLRDVTLPRTRSTHTKPRAARLVRTLIPSARAQTLAPRGLTQPVALAQAGSLVPVAPATNLPRNHAWSRFLIAASLALGAALIFENRNEPV